MATKTKKAQGAAVRSVKFNSYSDIVKPLDTNEQNIVLDMLMDDSDVTWGTTNFILIDSNWLIAELRSMSEQPTINTNHINEAIGRVTAAWVYMES